MCENETGICHGTTIYNRNKKNTIHNNITTSIASARFIEIVFGGYELSPPLPGTSGICTIYHNN